MTKYLLRPFVTVEIDDDGRMTVDYDDADTLIGRSTDDDGFEDYDGGADWNAIEPAYERWTRDVGLATDRSDDRVVDYNVVATIRVALMDVVPAVRAQDALLAGCAAVELVRDELDQAILDAGLDGRVATFGDQPVMQSATPVIEPRPKGPRGQGNEDE